MSQPIAGQPIAAREVLWTFQGESENESERDFFIALEKSVSAAIAQQIHPGSRVWVGREVHVRVGAYAVQARLTNIEPALATTVSAATVTIAKYRERPKDSGADISAFVSEVIRYPNEALGNSFDALVGLEAIKDDLFRKLTLLASPRYLDRWIANAYGERPPRAIIRLLRDRYPLIVLEGEVGSGKTALARSVGHYLALRLKTEMVLYIVNAQVRGGGHVGELTQNISRAFLEAERCQEREDIPVMVLIDEADALAQARGGRQTHHEDDAGVNTLIQRIDRLRGRPMAVLFATNLVQSLDAAILRRAAATYHFSRPTAQQRQDVFRKLLAETDISDIDIAQLVKLTEPRVLPGLGPHPHQYTYSDLAQRILPRAVEEAVYANQPVNVPYLINACRTTTPTPEMVVTIGSPQPFEGNGSIVPGL